MRCSHKGKLWLLGSVIALFGDEGGRAAGVPPGLVARCPSLVERPLSLLKALMSAGCCSRFWFLRDYSSHTYYPGRMEGIGGHA